MNQASITVPSGHVSTAFLTFGFAEAVNVSTASNRIIVFLIVF
jgi:hypothetical protein